MLGLVESHPIHITDAWKRYPFRTEPPQKAIIGSTLPGVRPLSPDNELIFSRTLHLSFITIWAWKSLKYLQIGHLQLHRLGVRIGYALDCCWTGRLAKRVYLTDEGLFFKSPEPSMQWFSPFFSPEQGILFYCLERNVAADERQFFPMQNEMNQGHLKWGLSSLTSWCVWKATSREWVSLLLPSPSSSCSPPFSPVPPVGNGQRKYWQKTAP